MQKFLDKIEELEKEKYEQYSFNHGFGGEISAKFTKKGSANHYILKENLSFEEFTPKRTRDKD